MPQTTIAYSIDNPAVATVDDAGLIEAKVPGNATVTGKVRSFKAHSNCIVLRKDCAGHAYLFLLFLSLGPSHRPSQWPGGHLL